MGVCDKYIMIGDEVHKAASLMEWAAWYETSDRSIGKTFIDGIRISTVFLGIDHGFNFEDEDVPPVLWETMVFGGPMDQEQWRYDSLEKAKVGHKLAVRLVVLTNKWWYSYYAKVKHVWRCHIQPYVEMI